MSRPIPVDPGDGGSGGTYPPVSPAPPAPAPGSPTPTPTPPPTPPPSPPAVPAASSRTSSLALVSIEPIGTYIVPLAPLPSQTLAITLGNQNCTIKIYTRSTGLYMDLYVAGVAIATGVVCLNRNIMVRATYLGFQGELVFIDSQGVSDPTYDGLGSRYNLLWLDY